MQISIKFLFNHNIIITIIIIFTKTIKIPKINKILIKNFNKAKTLITSKISTKIITIIIKIILMIIMINNTNMIISIKITIFNTSILKLKVISN